MRPDPQGELWPTGEKRSEYSEPTLRYAYVSPAKGETMVSAFGEALDYDKTILATNLDIDEHSRLWIDAAPFDDEGKPVPHNYIVKGIAPSLNETLIAVKQVTVSGSN